MGGEEAVGGPGRHRVVVVGAGFGGLTAVQHLKGSNVDICLIDQRNYHLFQPLLYQAATASLAPSEIAWPIRGIVRRRKDVRTLLSGVTGVDATLRRVHVSGHDPVPYDTLVLATGARHGYFGHDHWEPIAPGLKTIEDATQIRGRILRAFEAAERATDATQRSALLTFAIIGAGPTGVELAGTIAELAQDTLVHDFRSIDTRETTVLLIEASQQVLPGYDNSLSSYAQNALEELGVTIALGHPVTNVAEGRVTFSAHTVAAETIIWAAGVRPRRLLSGLAPRRIRTAGLSSNPTFRFLAILTFSPSVIRSRARHRTASLCPASRPPRSKGGPMWQT